MKPILPAHLVLFTATLFAVACSGQTPMERARELALQGHQAEAVELLEQLRDEGNPDRDLTLDIARGFRSLGELPKAEATLRRGLQANPADAEMLGEVVAIYTTLGQITRAMEMLESAREAGLGDEHVALSMGVCHGRRGDLAQARSEFEKAREAGADLDQVDYNLALLLSAEGEAAEALALYEALVERNPGHAAAKRELARALVEVQPDTGAERALALAWEASDALPEDWRCFEVAGDAYYALEDYIASLEAYENALRLGRNPSQVEEKYVRAKVALNEQE